VDSAEVKRVRHVLVVAHFFPPMGGGGVQRVTKFVKYLDGCGWRSTVIAGQPDDYWMRDDSLVADVPASARVVRTAAATGLGLLRRLRPGGSGSPARASRRSSGAFAALRRAGSWFLLPDTYIGWRPFALRAARDELARDPADVILSSGPPETNHVVALQLHRDTGVPWLVDFRDPWFQLHLHPAPTAWHRARHARMERAVLEGAAAATATTTWLRDLLRQRAPDGLTRLHVIRNGFDAEDFGPTPPPRPPTSPLRLVHTGMLTLTRSAEGLLAAISKLHARRPETIGAFDVELVGARESRNDLAAARPELHGCVRLRDYVPHREAIALMQGADVLVLIKHVEPRFRGLVPGKLYEYMGAGRPILALVPDSEAADLVGTLGWGEVAPPDDPDAIAAALGRMLEHKRAGRLDRAYERRGREQFERRLQAQNLAALLEQIAVASSEDGAKGAAR
jgi:glycosyltransferase involved in cell wall biosynthesis